MIVYGSSLSPFVRKVLVGANAFDREKIWHDLAHWQRGSASQLTDRALALVEFLRARCPWDAAQTSLSLQPYLLERRTCSRARSPRGWA